MLKVYQPASPPTVALRRNETSCKANKSVMLVQMDQLWFVAADSDQRDLRLGPRCSVCLPSYRKLDRPIRLNLQAVWTKQFSLVNDAEALLR